MFLQNNSSLRNTKKTSDLVFLLNRETFAVPQEAKARTKRVCFDVSERALHKQDLAEQGLVLCGGCKKAKTITDFTKDKAMPSGFSFYCKKCASENAKRRRAQKK